MGVLLLVTLAAGLLSAILLATLFDEPFAYRLLVMANFVVLCNLWLVIIFLSGMKAYKRILLVMFIGYALMVACAYLLRFMQMDGLLLALLIGHASLLFVFLYDILREYPARRMVAFDFLDRRQVFVSLLLTGLCYNLGIWIDKFIFWFNPSTSDLVIGPLRSRSSTTCRSSSPTCRSFPAWRCSWCASRPTSPSGTSGSTRRSAAERPCSTSACSRSR